MTLIFDIGNTNIKTAVFDVELSVGVASRFLNSPLS